MENLTERQQKRRLTVELKETIEFKRDFVECVSKQFAYKETAYYLGERFSLWKFQNKVASLDAEINSLISDLVHFCRTKYELKKLMLKQVKN